MPILKTKLHRPRVPADHVPRQRLLALLAGSSKKPLTLVSAPAGYGKSTFVSAWMEGLETSSAWLSLDEADSDLATFLSGFTAAVDSTFPGTCQRTRLLLTGAETPPRAALESELAGELAAIGEPFVLALDDYGFIKEPEIHELLARIIGERIPSLHLVIMTRRDPPLPLTSLRAAGGLAEIRQADLKFDTREASLFLEKSAGTSLDRGGASRLLEKTEGWAVGLRLASIALHGREDVGSFLREIGAETGHIQEYLLSEVLSRQPPQVREALLVTSILERFSAPLVSGLCGPGIEGKAFVDQLERSNIFCVPLDDRKEWYRYHHLFRELLRLTLDRRYSTEEIADFHRRAGGWHAGKGYTEAALRHFLAAGNTEEAARAVVAVRRDLMNGEEWHRLRRLLGMLPRAVVEHSPELLLCEGWLLIGWPEMAEVMVRVDALLEGAPGSPAGTEDLRGELDVIKSLVFYHVTDGSRSLEHARRGLERLPEEQASARGLAVMLEALAQQMNGDLKGAHATVYERLKDKDLLNTTYHARVLLTLCFMSHIAADLAGTVDAARQCLELGRKIGLAETIAHGYYFLGLCHYERNELEEAEAALRPVVTGPYIVNAHNYAFSAFALALALQATGRRGEAGEIVAQVIGYAMETGNSALMVTAQAFRAELALRRGRISEVNRWAETFEPELFTVAYRFTIPQMTLARWHLATASKGNTLEAREFLSKLKDFLLSINNRRLLVDVRAMEALLHDVDGDDEAALNSLEGAIALAEPEGLTRPFLDLGSPMAELFERLQGGKDGSFVDRILRASRAEGAPGGAILSPGPGALPDSLTTRETEILILLSDRLRNKEIADRLNISAETVRRHTANIYQKLDVHDRRQAVERAHALRLISGG